jgi:hypothetical protein
LFVDRRRNVTCTGGRPAASPPGHHFKKNFQQDFTLQCDQARQEKLVKMMATASEASEASEAPQLVGDVEWATELEDEVEAADVENGDDGDNGIVDYDFPSSAHQRNLRQGIGSDDDNGSATELLVTIQSPTFYFYGQIPDPSGERTTFGKYIDRDGTIYDGQWRNHQYHGYGSLFDPVENTVFVGQFDHSQKEGRGWMGYLDDGAVVSGEFTGSSDIIQGTIRYPSGDIYLGGIKGRLMHGRGFLYYSSGDWIALLSNEFEEGNLNGVEGIAIEAADMLLYHATFTPGIEEDTMEIDETLGVYTLEELGLGYEDILALALSDMLDHSRLFRTLDDLYLSHDDATPNWREWDPADWLAVSSALCLLAPLLRPATLPRIVVMLFEWGKQILRDVSDSGIRIVRMVRRLRGVSAKAAMG